MMSTSFKAVAIASCYYNGVNYYVLEFTRATPNGKHYYPPTTSQEYNVTYDSSYFTPRYVPDTGEVNTLQVEFGERKCEQLGYYIYKYIGEIRVQEYHVSDLTATWTSNSSNCVVDSLIDSPAAYFHCTKIGTYKLTGVYKLNGTEVFRRQITVNCVATDISKVSYNYYSANSGTLGSYYYMPGGVVPSADRFYVGKVSLTNGTHFTVLSVTNNTSLTTSTSLAKYTIKGDGVNIIGTRTFTFEIKPNNIQYNQTCTVTIPHQTYTGSALTPNPTIVVDGTTLVKGRDYDVSYSNDNVNVTDGYLVTCTITGKGNYTGTRTRYFSIDATTISDTCIAPIPDQICTGNPLSPAVTITWNGRRLTEGTDYTVSYIWTESVGPAYASIQMQGNFTGSHRVVFNVVAPSYQIPTTGLQGFVARLYTLALNRAPAENEIAYWVNAANQGMTGADIARNFLLSDEFIGRSRSSSEFVSVLYQIFFNRDGDTAGINYWVGLMNGGMTKPEIINGFINTPEWESVCASYGIASGSTRTANAVRAFATRLYSTCLGREGDAAGIEYWTNALLSGEATGTAAARTFFFSSEFVDQNISNEEFVARLYRTFMGREPDATGLNFWLNKLASGATRQAVFDGFAGTSEFINLCTESGINP